MFTGIVEEKGIVRSFTEQAHAWRLVLEARVVTEGLQLGDSVAVNGCCLTVVAFSEDRLEFDLLAESVRLTSIEGIGPGVGSIWSVRCCLRREWAGILFRVMWMGLRRLRLSSREERMYFCGSAKSGYAALCCGEGLRGRGWDFPDGCGSG